MIDAKKLEKLMKGAANHWRLKILFLLSKEPGLSLTSIADSLDGHFKTISAHTRMLVESGLLQKRYKNRTVLHFLTPVGEKLLSKIVTLI